MDTIGYYNQNAKQFYVNTVELSMEEQLERFTKLLPENSSILDLGCGSGRDSLYLIERGFDVTAMDGSHELCELAKIHVGQDILHMDFQEIDFNHVFDGIWACASLLHVEKVNFYNILNKVVRSLKKDGILYMSFRYGEFNGYREDRFYQDFTENTLEQAVREFDNLDIIDIYKTDDVNPDRKMKWVNILLKKQY